MAYNAWSVVFGEQPTAAKWNQLGTNDAGFRDGTNIQDDAIDSRHIAAGAIDFEHIGADIWDWQLLGRHTLSSNANTLTVSGFTAKKYLKILLAIVAPTASVTAEMRFNSDSGNNYANRNSTDGAADATQTSVGLIYADVTGNQTNKFNELDVLNIAAQVKLVKSNSVEPGSSGAGNAPSKRESNAKWHNTSNAITRVDVTTPSNNYGSGSDLIVLGHD